MKDHHLVEHTPVAPVRPQNHPNVLLADIAVLVGAAASAEPGVQVRGVSLDSRAIVPGDLYIALPGARAHGADYGAAAIAAGAVAILTDDDGVHRLGANPTVPVIVCADPRAHTGAVAALIYGTGSKTEHHMPLYAVTGTNGKTTTTYFLTSLLQALGNTTGLIGTIEILAGEEPIPSKLTTPESTDVHAILAVMAERGLDAAAMEVSSHALSFGRVDSVLFDVAGFSNLTQDHLDLHGGMEGYFATKAELFTPRRARQAVITVDDSWGQRMAAVATVPVTTLNTRAVDVEADYTVRNMRRDGIGSRFELHGPHSAVFSVRTGLPGDFNVSNAALALAMVLQQLLSGSGEPAALANVVQAVQVALDACDPFTIDVPGRMQLIGTAPVAIVDFAHNPDALQRALTAVRSEEAGSKVIVVFGATGERDVTKRPIMGAVAVENADVVLIADDDPHDEDPARIRADVLAGAAEANARLALGRVIAEFDQRADAIRHAVAIAGPHDTILVAGRGHEIFQEVKGVNVALDDRAELREALRARGFPFTSASRIES